MIHVPFKYTCPDVYKHFNSTLLKHACFDIVEGQTYVIDRKLDRHIINNSLLDCDTTNIYIYNNESAKGILREISVDKIYQKTLVSLFTNKFEYILIRNELDYVLLIPAGINIYSVLLTNAPKKTFKTLLKSFLSIPKHRNNFIDVTTYNHMFQNTLIYHMRVLKKYDKNIPTDNILIAEYLNSCWFDKVIGSKQIVGIYNSQKYVNSSYKKNNDCFKNCEKSTITMLYKDKLLVEEKEDYDFLDFVTFLNFIKEIPQFAKYDSFAELRDVYSFNGTFLGIKENDQLVGACAIEKIGQKYVYISYLSVSLKHQKQGLGKKILQAIDTYLNEIDKLPILIVINPNLISFYQKNGYLIHSNIFDSEL